MTKHPLTNKKAFKKFSDHTIDITTEVAYTPDGIRAAADWQLEQVFEWLRNDEYLEAIAQPANVEDIIDDLKAAMRPTQEDN